MRSNTILSNEDFNNLINMGIVVPRNKQSNVDDGLTYTYKIGKVYTIKNKTNNDTTLARCSQNCPYKLTLVYMWIKQGIISKKQFITIIEHITHQ